MRLFFSTLTARRIIGSWVEDYTTARSHSSFWTTRRRHSPPNISPQLATTPRHPSSACWPVAHIAPESVPTPRSPPPLDGVQWRVIRFLPQAQNLAAMTGRLATKEFTRPRRPGCSVISMQKRFYDLVGTIQEHLHHRADRPIF